MSVFKSFGNVATGLLLLSVPALALLVFSSPDSSSHVSATLLAQEPAPMLIPSASTGEGQIVDLADWNYTANSKKSVKAKNSKKSPKSIKSKKSKKSKKSPGKGGNGQPGNAQTAGAQSGNAQTAGAQTGASQPPKESVAQRSSGQESASANPDSTTVLRVDVAGDAPAAARLLDGAEGVENVTVDSQQIAVTLQPGVVDYEHLATLLNQAGHKSKITRASKAQRKR